MIDNDVEGRYLNEVHVIYWDLTSSLYYRSKRYPGFETSICALYVIPQVRKIVCADGKCWSALESYKPQTCIQKNIYKYISNQFLLTKQDY